MKLVTEITKQVTLPSNGVFRCMTCTIPKKGSVNYYSDAKDILKTMDVVLNASEKTVEDFARKKDPLSALFAVLGTGRLLESKNPRLLRLKKIYFNNDSSYNNEAAIRRAVNAVGDTLDLNVDVTI